MTSSDPHDRHGSPKQFWDQLTTDRKSELTKRFFAFSTGRAEFFDVLYERVDLEKVEHNLDLAVLTSERTFQIAEFFALLIFTGLNTSDSLGKFIEGHNQAIEVYQNNPNKARLFGVGPQRQKKAFFSPAAKEIACSHFQHFGAFDQSDLARFLYHHMSEETCRKTVQALATVGILERIPVGTSKLVKSTGALEQAYVQMIGHQI